MPSTRLASLVSRLRRWIADFGALVGNLRRFNVRDRPPDFWGRDEALKPAFVRVRRERDGR